MGEGDQGYTMLVVSAAYAANAALYSLPYDPVNDVAPVALVGETGFVMTLHPSGPAMSRSVLNGVGGDSSG